MPILPAEPDVHPSNLWHLDQSIALSNPRRRWWCLHTRPRQEKTAARHLRSLDIPYYLPQVVRASRTPGGRRIRSVVPLFTGYLFLLGDDRQRVEALRGNHLANVLEVTDQEGLVNDLRQIHRMLNLNLPVFCDVTYPTGTRVRVMEGPLCGMVGTIVRRQNRRDKFVAVVEFLGQGASVELMNWQVCPLA